MSTAKKQIPVSTDNQTGGGGQQQQSQPIDQSNAKEIKMTAKKSLVDQNGEQQQQDRFSLLPSVVPNVVMIPKIPKDLDRRLQDNQKRVIQVFDQIKNNKADGPIIFQQPQPDKKKEEALDEHIKSVFVQVGIIPKWMLTRVEGRCKHKHSCYENVAYGFTNTLLYGLAIKLIVNNVHLVARPQKLARNLVSWKSQKDNLRWALFLALTNGVYKLVLCLMRRLVKSDKVAALVAGFLAGLTCRLDAKKRRQLLTILLLSRVADSMFAMGEKREYVKRIPCGEFLIWLLCNVCQQYAMACESDTLNPGQYKFQRNWSLLSKSPPLQGISSAFNQSMRDHIAMNAKPGVVVNFGK